MGEIRFEEVKLDTRHGDDHAVLVIRDGRVAAVLSQLGDLHEELMGSWFVEVAFADHGLGGGQVFKSPADFVSLAGWRETFAQEGSDRP